MNRDVKFRGWFQGINGIEMWIYGYLVKQDNGNFEITNGETSYTVDSVGQFTGLTDKNGVDIYEGDIYHQGDENIKYEVIWEGAGFVGNQIGTKSNAGLEYFQKDIVIVGNIHDNAGFQAKC